MKTNIWIVKLNMSIFLNKAFSHGNTLNHQSLFFISFGGGFLTCEGRVA